MADQTLEERALAALLAWTDPDEGGFHIHEWPLDMPHKGRMTLDQFMDALGRLRRKGLVECREWHPGQRNGAAREWLWFPTLAAIEHVREKEGRSDG